jgi:H+/Cl- antiporter ClcA/CBS domain-containing protein
MPVRPADDGAGPASLTPAEYEPVNRRSVSITALAMLVGIAAGFVAQLLLHLIGLVTNLAFHGRISAAFVSPDGHRLGPWGIAIPLVGAVVVGLMARYGSAAIRGHGIPEVMERVLRGESRISARVMVLKPLSAAVAIGTGGPFGAEGPIIATGGALGSVLGQLPHITADERKTLLAAGAAAGMAATFGSPVSAVLLAVELLLFEYRPRSLIPVALATAAATAVRLAFDGGAPVFPMPEMATPTGTALGTYAVLGGLMGAVAVGVTHLAYGIEDGFERLGERLGIHWMWWPFAGALVVGIVGYVEPRTLGVGYDNITGALAGTIAGRALLVLVVLKLLSWAVYLGSGTSGGTLAPLFTIGGGLGAWAGAGLAAAAPVLGVDPHMAGLVGMAAIFAGASHALLASVVFAFETTRQPVGLLPLLAGCAGAYLVALLLDRHSIMTMKLARRGTSVRTEYAVDHLAHVLVKDAMSRTIVSLRGTDTIEQVRTSLARPEAAARTRRQGAWSHNGFPVLDDHDRLLGVLTRRDLFDPSVQPSASVAALVRRAPIVCFEHTTLRAAADLMVVEEVGRLPVVAAHDASRVIGIITRSDLLAAHAPRLRAARYRSRTRTFLGPLGNGGRPAA